MPAGGECGYDLPVLNVRIVLMVASFVLSVAIGLTVSRRGGVAAAGGAAAAEGPLLVGLSLDTLKEARWQADRDLFVARCKELGAEVLVQSANSEDTRQMQDVEALISRGVRALVIVPHDAKTMAKAVEVAHASKIPVIAYDRMIRDADVDLYVSFDNVKVGEQQAEYLLAHLPQGKGAIVRVHGAPTDDNAKAYKAGQDRVLQPYLERGDVKVVHEDWAEDWKPENGKKIVNAAITQHGRAFDAVLAANDGTAGGAIQALTEEGIAGKVLVTGQDAELAAVQRVASGAQTMTVYKPIKSLAARGAEAAVRLARREVVVARTAVPNGKIDVPAILEPTVAVDRTNLESTVIADGFHAKDDVFRGASAATP